MLGLNALIFSDLYCLVVSSVSLWLTKYHQKGEKDSSLSP